MGTPEYAVRVLEGLRRVVSDEEIWVVTQPDAPTGRRHRVQPSAVARYAIEHGLRLDRPLKLSSARQSWVAYAPDVIVTAAYGRILPPWLLSLPRRAINLHASLLPRWRGPNPIFWSIYAGDSETGVTLMEMRAGIDDGPIVAQRAVAISESDTLSTLTERLADIAALLLVETWPDLFLRAAVEQSDEGITYAPKISREMARIDWTRTAEEEARRIRSMAETPGAYTMWDDRRLRGAPAGVRRGTLEPGQIMMEGENWVVGCGQDVLVLTKVQPEGKRWMTPAAFVRGLRTPRPERLA
jgi:methionyl-tRNA formyltransferase